MQLKTLGVVSTSGNMPSLVLIAREMSLLVPEAQLAHLVDHHRGVRPPRVLEALLVPAHKAAMQLLREEWEAW